MRKSTIAVLLAAMLFVQAEPIFATENQEANTFGDGSAEASELQSSQIDLNEESTDSDETIEDIFTDDYAENLLADGGSSTVRQEDFPDKTFRDFIFSNYDLDHDNILSESEISQVTSIVISEFYVTGIKDITGIERFPFLNNLCCTGQEVESIDVSKNTALTRLQVEENKLKKLDVRNNTALEVLWCDDNQLTELDVSRNTALKELSCHDNQIDKIDLSQNRALERIICDDNNLKKIDVSKNAALSFLSCSDNKLTELDVSNNSSLTGLSCSNNELTSIDVSKNPSLNSLSYSGNHISHWNAGDVVLITGSAYNQTITASVTQKNGKTQLDLGEIVGKENVGRVTVLDPDNYGITQNGSILYFNASPLPESFEYEYNTGIDKVVNGKGPTSIIDFRMNVRVILASSECKHVFGEYVVTTPPTIFSSGIATRTCTICGKTETKTLEKLSATIKLSASKLTLKVGQSYYAGSLVSGIQEGDFVNSWKSSNANIASVDKDGKITGKKAGTATIQVTLKSGISSKIKVTIQKKTVSTTKITGLKKSMSLKVGKTKTLKPVIHPVGSQQKITFKSSNTKVATINSDGVLKGVKKGTAKITVTSGKVKFVIKVNIKK